MTTRPCSVNPILKNSGKLQLMRANGFNVMAGNFAVAEVLYTEEEVAELKAAKLLPDDWVAPKPLLEYEVGNHKEGVGY
jgi:hypothetical protein